MLKGAYLCNVCVESRYQRVLIGEKISFSEGGGEVFVFGPKWKLSVMTVDMKVIFKRHNLCFGGLLPVHDFRLPTR
jgi:hypothetical protein